MFDQAVAAAAFDSDLLVGAPTPETIAMLLVADPEGLTADDATAAAIAAELAGRMFHGIQLRFLAAAAGQRREPGELSSVGQELSAAAGLYPPSASSRVDLACSVMTRLPTTLRLLEAGTLRPYHVEIVERATRELTDEHARIVDAAVAPGPAGLAKRLAEALTRIDPKHLEKKAEKAQSERTVEFWTDATEGKGGIELIGPIERIAQLKAAIDSQARQRQPGDDRSLGARRFDVLFAWARDVLGLEPMPSTTAMPTNPPPPPAGSSGGCGSCGRSDSAAFAINVTVTLEALLGLSETPGELDGHPIPASVARELAADGRWRRWVTESATGRLLDIGSATYRPGAELQRFVRGRDRTCIFPSCRVRAERCDLDHTKAFHTQGGATVAANLGPVCRSHHRCKHEIAWRYGRDPDGRIRWTAPSGRTYTTEPDRYADDPFLSAYLTRTSAARRERERKTVQRAARDQPRTTTHWDPPAEPHANPPF